MKFGKKVLGKKEWARQQRAYEEAKRRGFKYGKRVTGETATAKGPKAKGASKQAPEAPVVPPQAPKPEPATTKQRAPGDEAQHLLSVDELGEVLKGDVSADLLDELVAAEFERPEGEPRKGALRLLLQAEQARGDAARKPIIAELQGALNKA